LRDFDAVAPGLPLHVDRAVLMSAWIAKLLSEIFVCEIKVMYLCCINDSTMEAAINRKSAMFRLREELLERLKQLAARDNRSLNNYVETILMDVVYNTPNATTVAAMREAENEENLTTVNMDSYESFLKSLDLK